MPTNNKNESITKLAGKGALWQFSSGTLSSVIRLGSSAVLARLLNPIDFGILGMGILAMNAIAYLGNMGIGAAIVAKKDLNDDDLSTAFWVLCLNRLILYTLAFLSAPLLAKFFNEPRVIPVFRVVSLVFLFSALEAIPRSLLGKELKYKELFFVNCSVTIIESFMAIFLVIFTGLRYWALVWAMLISYLCGITLLWVLVKWKPKFKFSKNSFSFYKRYITNGLGNSIVLYFRQNIDYLVVGRLLGATSLGLYEYAYKIPHMFIDRFIFPITSVLFPALSKIQDDKIAVSSGFLRAFRLISFIAIPSLLLLAATADLLVPILWGDKWLSIITPLKILCFAAMINAIFAPSNQIFWLYRRPDLAFKNNLCQLLTTLLFVYIGGHFWGINGIALGMVLGLLPNIYFFFLSLRIISLELREIFSSLFLIFFISILTASVMYFLGQYSSLFVSSKIIRLILSLSFSLLFFLLSTYILLAKLYQDMIYVIKLSITKR